MFKLGQSDSYKWPVKVAFAADGGKETKQQFDAMFKRLSALRVQELGDALTKGEVSEDALVKDILIGWDGVQDEHGEPLPFSDGARDQLMDIFPVRPSVITAWLESLKVGRAKN